MHADAAGQLMKDHFWLGSIGDVVDAEAALAIGLLLGGFDLEDVGLADAELLRQFGTRRLAPERLAQFARTLGICSARRPTAVMLRS